MKTAATWRAGVASDPGLQRSNNEDRVFVDEAAGTFLVVDGVGGQAAGEKAAEIAVQIIPQELALAKGSIEERMRQAIAAANNQIFQLAQSNAEWRGMACVLTLAVAQGDRITVGHVGDSRLYLAWDGKLRKLTSDHSPVGEREDQGELTEEEAMKHPRRNEVFRDVGSRPRDAYDEDFIEIRNFPFRADAAFLLCSDGLSDTVSSSEISSIVETYDGNPESVTKQLVEAANLAGGKDNISVVFVAGHEFMGTESQVLRDARSRHAITRMRRNRTGWRVFVNRLLWLLSGALLGILIWNSPRRLVPRPNPVAATEPAHIPTIVDATDPLGIIKAMGAAHTGDTIEVPPGQFSGPIQLRDGVNLVSEKVGEAVIHVDRAAAQDAGTAFIARGVRSGRLSGFRIEGDDAAPLSTGVLLDHATIEIDDLDISGARDCGIRIDGASGGVLRANFVHDNTGCGVWIGGESGPRLVGNRISENGMQPGALRPGIEIQLPASPVLENNIIRGNGQRNFGSLPATVEDGIRRSNVTEGKGTS